MSPHQVYLCFQRVAAEILGIKLNKAEIEQSQVRQINVLYWKKKKNSELNINIKSYIKKEWKFQNINIPGVIDWEYMCFLGGFYMYIFISLWCFLIPIS